MKGDKLRYLGRADNGSPEGVEDIFVVGVIWAGQNRTALIEGIERRLNARIAKDFPGYRIDGEFSHSYPSMREIPGLAQAEAKRLQRMILMSGGYGILTMTEVRITSLPETTRPGGTP